MTFMHSGFAQENYPQQSPEAFSTMLVNALRNKDYKAYKMLFISTDDFTLMVQKNQADEKRIAEEIENFKTQNTDEKCLDDFNQFIAYNEMDGLDFTKLEYAKNTRIENTTANEIQANTLIIEATAGTIHYEIKAVDCIINKGWYKLTQRPIIKQGWDEDVSLNKYTSDLMLMLQKTSFEEYKKFVITDKEFINLVENSTSLDTTDKKHFYEKLEKDSPERHAQEKYNEFINKVKEYGIDLNNASDVRFDSKRKMEKSYEFARIKIYFMFMKKNYEISVRDNLKTPAGWKLLDEIHLRLVPEVDQQQVDGPVHRD
jgi:hypothetical protein